MPHLGAQGLHHSDMAGALKGLSLMQAQALLAASQPGHKQDMGPTRVPEEWQQTLQDMLRNDRQNMLNHRCPPPLSC